MYISQQHTEPFLQLILQTTKEALINTKKNPEMIPCILSDHSELKQEINSKTKLRKYINTYRLSYTFLNFWKLYFSIFKPKLNFEIRKETVKVLRVKWTLKDNLPQPLGYSQSPMRKSQKFCVHNLKSQKELK